MNSAFPREFYPVTRPSEDLRPQYEASIRNVLRILWTRRWLIAAVIVAVTGSAIAASFILPKKYVGEALIQLKFDGMGSNVSATAAAPPVSVDANALVEGEAEIIRSRAVARRVVDRLAASGHSDQTMPPPAKGDRPNADAGPAPAKGESPLDQAVMEIRKGLSVQNDGKSYLIRVIYTADDPQRAALLANAFAEEYLQSRVESSFTAAKRMSEWLAAQVEGARQAAQAADAKVKAFRAGIITSDGADTVAAADQQLRDVIAQISNARLDRLKIENRVQRLRDTLASDRMPSASDLDGAGAAQQLIAELVKARQNVDRIAASVGVKHPLFVKAKNTYDDVHAQFLEAVGNAVGNAEADLSSARSAERTLEEQAGQLRQAVLDNQANQKRLAQLETEAATARGNLDRLQESFRQASALADLKPIPAEMVSPAEPLAIPTSPKKPLFAVLGGMGGILASLGLVFLLEMRDRGFQTEEDVAATLGIPCLGMVPFIGKRVRPIVRRFHDRAIKLLIIRSGLLRRQSGHSVVVVTSAVPGEGKTDLVRSVATTLAQAGRRVLVVENLLQKEAASEPKALRRLVAVESMQGDAGATAISYYHRSTHDLSEVLDGPDRLQGWIDENGAHFDVVIFEAPPVMLDAQAMMIAQAANLILLSVRWNATSRSTVKVALSQLAAGSGQGPDVAAVLTHVDMKRHRRLGRKDSLYFYGRHADRAIASAA
ncbi:GumC family protein [Jiella sp. M17.18]|uniref:GumC family protein n=1 Tax=Jiella sp. M17.18 TaxID=3234247 RepID=UPI0034DF2F53